MLGLRWLLHGALIALLLTAVVWCASMMVYVY